MLYAHEIIRLLELKPHPEGGYYRETFRDEPGPDGRAASRDRPRHSLARPAAGGLRLPLGCAAAAYDRDYRDLRDRRFGGNAPRHRGDESLCVKVAMDDFGAGHTSFRNMRNLRVDLLKIDGAFVQNLARSEDDRFFVRTLVELARHLEIPTGAEWVEDAESVALLTDLGVVYLQGHYLGQAEALGHKAQTVCPAIRPADLRNACG